jgi:hypothetical protein
MTLFATPMLAIGFGAFLLCAETCLHLDEVLTRQSWLALPIYDWATGLFLVYSGVRSRREWATGRLYQIAGWAFNVSLLGGAFLGTLEEWTSGTPVAEEWFSAEVFLTIIAFLFAVSVCALASTMMTSGAGRHGERS